MPHSSLEAAVVLVVLSALGCAGGTTPAEESVAEEQSSALDPLWKAIGWE